MLLRSLLFLVAQFLGERVGVIEHFVDAAGSGVRISVIEDAKQVPATTRDGHSIPTFASAWMARESDLENGRQFPLRIHDREQAFRNLFRATDACFAAFRFGDPLGDVAAGGMIQLVIPAAKRAIFAENALEFIRNGDGPLFAVEFHLESGNVAFDGSRSFLHPLVDQQKVPALSGGKERSAERESVDFAFYFDLAAQPPGFGCIERYANDDPVQAGAQALKLGLETLGGRRGLSSGGFWHGRTPGVCILI